MISGPQVGIGLSRNSDSESAGKEAVLSALQSLREGPKFALLFATRHYECALNKIVKAAYQALPKNTPLIGGTVAGFATQQGCFTRGVACLALFHPKLDAVAGFGKRTKANPTKAADQLVATIKNGLKNTQYKNRLLLLLISGATMPLPNIVGKVNTIKSKLLGTLLTHLGLPIFALWGYGVGKEETIVERISKQLPEFHIIGGSCIDNFSCLANYQFLNDKVLTNSVVGIGCATDLSIHIDGVIGLRKTNKTFEITHTAYEDRVITKINNLDAKQYFLEKVIGLPEKQFKALGPFYYKTSDYFPITFEGRTEFTSGIGAFLGSNLLLGYKAQSKKVRLLSATGEDILNSIDKLLSGKKLDSTTFALFFSSGIRANILGDKAREMQRRITKYLKSTPFLEVYVLNEYLGNPFHEAVARVYSFNILTMVSKDG